MRHLLARWSSLKPSKRFRVIALVVVTVGVGGAYLLYWMQTRGAGPTMDDLMPGYTRKRERQMGIMMGSLGMTMMEWMDALKEPRTQAIIIAAVATLAALALLRVASLLDRPHDHAAAPPDHH